MRDPYWPIHADIALEENVGRTPYRYREACKAQQKTQTFEFETARGRFNRRSQGKASVELRLISKQQIPPYERNLTYCCPKYFR